MRLSLISYSSLASVLERRIHSFAANVRFLEGFFFSKIKSYFCSPFCYVDIYTSNARISLKSQRLFSVILIRSEF